MSILPTHDDVLDARRVLASYLTPTPLYSYGGLSELLGCTAFLKHENHQPIGVFKVRGGINVISRLDGDAKSRGVVTASTGNHGQAIAFASRLFDVRANVVVPVGSNPDKVRAIRSFGASIIEHGKDFDEAREHAERLSAERGFRYIHSANEPHLIAGAGTIGLEILDRLPEVDVILVPVGGGSGASGICLAVKSQNPHVEIIGVQSSAAPAAHESWKAGMPVALPTMRTFAEGLATRVGFEMTVRIMKQHLTDFLLVSDDEIRSAMRIIIEQTHNLVEAAGAASLAGALKMKERLSGKNVVMILSGANITLNGLRELLPHTEHA
jgi:threonine dehydratase